MDPQRERIQADLRGLLAGEVHCDDRFTVMYGSDASIYQVQPLGVVRPRGVADVRAVVGMRPNRACPCMPAARERASPASRSVAGY